MSPLKRFIFLVLAPALLAASPAVSMAQAEFPNKPIHVILPYSSGGKNDILTRVVGEQLELRWNQRLIVESKPSANGRLAYETVAHAAPDGYTLVSAVSSLSTLPYMYKQLDFDPQRDLAPVTQMFQNQSTIVINPDIPAKSIKEFLAWAKSNPGKVNYGTQGKGNIVHMVFEMLNRAGGAGMTAIHYKGTAEVNLALQRGDVQASLDSLPPIARTPKGEPFRVLAVLTDQRVPEYPDIPMLMESGLFEQVPTSWVGLMAAANTPKSILEKIASDVRSVMRGSPAVAEKYKANGAVIIASTPDEFARKLQGEHKLYGELVKLVGVEPQ